MRLITYIFLFLFFAGCTMQENRKPVNKKIGPSQSMGIMRTAQDSFKYLCQYWKVEDAFNPLGKDVEGEEDSAVINSPGLLFLSDSSLVENPRGTIRFGKFAMNGKKISARFDDGKPAQYIISRFRNVKMELTREEKNNLTVLKLNGDSVTYEFAETNPFHPLHNKWRIKPTRLETDAELISRLRQYMEFYIMFFDDNLKRNSSTISFDGLPCCFNWYKGGISVDNAKKLDPKFAMCFYNSKQAEQARKIMEDVITKKYRWVPDIDNWVEQTLPVLRQIKDNL